MIYTSPRELSFSFSFFHTPPTKLVRNHACSVLPMRTGLIVSRTVVHFLISVLVFYIRCSRAIDAPESICSRCGKPSKVCLCSVLPAEKLRTPNVNDLLLQQHPEAGAAMSTPLAAAAADRDKDAQRGGCVVAGGIAHDTCAEDSHDTCAEDMRRGFGREQDAISRHINSDVRDAWEREQEAMQRRIVTDDVLDFDAHTFARLRYIGGLDISWDKQHAERAAATLVLLLFQAACGAYVLKSAYVLK